MMIAPLQLLSVLHRVQNGLDTGSASPALPFARDVGLLSSANLLTLAGHEFLNHINVGALDEASKTLREKWPAYHHVLSFLNEEDALPCLEEVSEIQGEPLSREDEHKLWLFVAQLGQGWLHEKEPDQLHPRYGGRRPSSVDFAAELFNSLNGQEWGVWRLLPAIGASQRMSPWAIHHAFLRGWSNTSLSKLVDLYPAPPDFQVLPAPEYVVGMVRGEPQLVRVPANVFVVGKEMFSILAPK